MPDMTNLPPELESNLRRALETPGPDAEFVARLRTQLEHEAKMKTNQGVEKLPFFHRNNRSQEISDSKKRISPRLAWGLAALLLAVIVTLLATSPTVVEAMKKLFGYVPGAGLVEQGSSLRVLSEPVVVTRDGITLTVTQAIASPDKTVVAYKVENIPESALAPNYSEGQTPPPTCNFTDYLQLPDGTIFSAETGQGGSWFLGFEYRENYAALPAEVNSANLLVSCLMGTSPGKAPESWIIPLAFVPAPPDMTIAPVIEITPSPEATVEAGVTLASTALPNPISLEKVITLDDGYILIGSLHSVTTAEGLVTSPYPWNVNIVDANGQDIPYDYATDVDLSGGDAQSQPWAYQINGKSQAWPISIEIDAMDATLPQHDASFQFDTGPNPQNEQVWTLDQDVQVGDYTVRVQTVTRTPDGYAFSFQADPAVSGLSVTIPGFDTAPAGGGGGGDGAGSLSAGISYSGQVPEGQLTVVLETVTILVPGPWSLQWQPENAVQAATPTPSSGPAACLTDDTWAQAKSSTPAQIPSNLTGNFFILGQKENSDIYGIRQFSLTDGSSKFLAEAYWPVASPDGSKVVYTTDVGMTIYTVATGETFNVPNTDTSDYRTLWSPDGSRLAFVRSNSNLLMVINADGTSLQQVADLSVVFKLLVGWADNEHLLIAEPAQGGTTLQSLSLADGSTTPFSSINLSSLKANAVISPDGQWIAYTSSRGGNGSLGNGLYIARLDGSQQRIIAAINGLALYFPIFSPDGKWMIVSIPDLTGNGPSAQALIELDTCRVVSMPNLGGEVYAWGR